VARSPADAGLGARFYLIGYLPTYAAALFLLVLVWAGAPGWSDRADHRIRFTAAWATASHLSLGEVVMLALAVALLAVVLHPLQLALMSVFQGSWPAWLGARWARRRQKTRRDRLARAARLPHGPELTEEAIQRTGAAGYQLRRYFPQPDHLLRPTALGNVLAAIDDSAGRTYGLDAVIAWPRLYPVLGEPTRSLVDDRRDTLDAAVRLAATMAVTAFAALILLVRSGWWALLALIPLAVAALAYNAAVQAALAYAETVQVAFDLYVLIYSLPCGWNCPDGRTPRRSSTSNGAISGARESRCPSHWNTPRETTRVAPEKMDKTAAGSCPSLFVLAPRPGRGTRPRSGPAATRGTRPPR
jgi:hypothetical protein